MKLFKSPRLSRLFLFGCLSVILITSLFYNQVARSVLSPGVLQYIPKEHTLLLASGGIEGIWEAMEAHFGSVIRNEEEKGILTPHIRQLDKYFKENDMPISAPSDLSAHGFDLNRGMLLSFPRLPIRQMTDGDSDDLININMLYNYLILLPVQGENAVISFFSKLTGTDPAKGSFGFGECATKGERERIPQELAVFNYENLALSMIQPDVALIGSGIPYGNPGIWSILRRSLFNRKGNLLHALDNDALYDTLRRRLRYPFSYGPEIFFLWQPQDFSPIKKLMAVASLGKDTIRLELDLELLSSVTKILRQILKAPTSDISWWRFLPSNTAAVFVLQDSALNQYLDLPFDSRNNFLRFIDGDDLLKQWMEERYGGLLAEVRSVNDLHRLALAVTGYRHGLPEVVMGIWGDRGALDKLIFRMQRRFRLKRDETILKGAVKAFTEKFPEQTRTPAIADLMKLEFLKDEPYALFEKYPITRQKVNRAHLRPEEFMNPTYRHKYKDWIIKYLLPPITENDFDYRFELKDLDRQTLQTDRYRMASIVMDDVLWVATEVGELKTLLDRSRTTSGTLARHPGFRAATTEWSGREKIQIFLNMDRITTLGLLSPESEVEEWVKNYLIDLKDHPAVSLALLVGGAQNRLQLSSRMVLRSGIKP